MTDDLILSVAWREEIISSFEQRLRAQGNPILDSALAHQQILAEARSILDEVVERHRAATQSPERGSRAPHVGIGASQAIEAMHPADSLHAASVLFETALPVVKRAFSGGGRPESEIALTLHRVVMSWVSAYAVSHTVLVLKTIRDSHRAELARLARDLHDRAAHAIGVALQNLELHEVHSQRDTASAHEKFHRAREAMREAMDSVRYISAELRMTVRPGELEQTLREYLASNADETVLTTLQVTGNTTMLPREVCEEVYFTVREAIRNALVHSGATRLDITIGINDSHLHARVTDTGRGFSIEHTTHTGTGLGLSSMRERVQLLGGELHLSSLPGHGTTVDISIPFDSKPPSVH